ncbi:MAG TPA: sugar ABC transporter ATP-binding protein [Galbitalea sp.]|jgi:ABC-type sugar transport system ATPase subunit
MGAANPAIELKGVTKRFGGIPAVSGVSFAIAPGEVVALAGENGAGKSTVKNLIGGLLHPDEGEILVDGAPRGAGVADLRRQGVTTVHQEISLFPHLSVAENVLINHMDRYPALGLSPRRMRADAKEYLKRVGATFDAGRLVGELSTGQRQLVEVAKALADHPQVLVLDEPTSSLNLAERAKIAELVASLSAEGVAILYIGHSLDELFQLSHRIVVMRDGALVSDTPTGDLTRTRLEELMVGREIAKGYPATRQHSDELALVVTDLGDDRVVSGVNFQVRKGEIFGLAGLMGAGRTEVARAIFGLSVRRGTVAVGGRTIANNPRAAIAAGIAFVTEDRRDEGIYIDRSIRETLSSVVLPQRSFLGIVNRRAEQAQAAERATEMKLTARAGLEADGGSLSGGNQQKVVIGKWLTAEPEVLILDEPTRGIDVGAKAEIYRVLVDLAARGMAILLISSEMEEVIGLSHRVGVMTHGRLVGVLDRDEANQGRVIALATGGAA